ncbi:MAG: DUF4175 family protein [Bryobacterales bacterium]|nr:DUF4175 family protein [Bryobacterales bacterium]
MNALQELNRYLRGVELRLLRLALWRGLAALALLALGGTLVAVLAVRLLTFSAASVAAARWLLYFVLALAAAFLLVKPLIRLNRVRAAERAERAVPGFEQRLVTIAERQKEAPAADPFLELLAEDTLERARQNPEPVRAGSRLAGYVSAAGAALGGLIWLAVAGPGFLGYGARLLWGGPDQAAPAPYYTILVAPGDAAVRRGGDQWITAQLVGFEAAEVRLAVRYEGTARWEEAPMRPRNAAPGFEFLLAGIPRSLDYFVSAGRIRSRTHRLRVVDLPRIQRLRVTYRYPSWTGLAPAVEDPGGDLRAVEGTEAEIAVETDRPLENGFVELEDGRSLPLEPVGGNWRRARIALRSDGRYFIATRDRDQTVRLSEDYLILVERDEPPTVRIRRPGRDLGVSPIEEVTVVVEASDEFGLKDLALHYRVNGGPERRIALLEREGVRQAEGTATLYLEDFGLAPGDVVGLYATARDARHAAQTDIYFLEAQPFEREYSQAQTMAGTEGEGGEQDQARISERQKEIIAATWNQIRARSQDRETARFLADVQARLRDQARSLARRMQSRELSRANEEFESFAANMEKAASAMEAASRELAAARWEQALGPEQQALQHLLRAEATFRQIQVAFGNRGAGRDGARSGAGRELESLFELELDTEKNQYETGTRARARTLQERQFEEALRRLEELARRQQELAARQGPRPSIEQRWQQEMLRREALQLQREMERLARGGATGGATEPQARGEAASRQARPGQTGRSGVDQRVEQALERLAQAAREMGRPGGQQEAAERLRQARELLGGLEREQMDERVTELTRRSEQLAARQREFAERLRQRFGSREARGSWEEAARMAEEKQQMAAELEALQRELEQSLRAMAGGQRAAASRLREALGDLQRMELATRMRYNAELIRRGWGAAAVMREAPVTAALEQLRDQLREARAALDRAAPPGENLQRALEALARARQRLAGAGRDSRSSAEQGAQERDRAARRPGAVGESQPHAGEPAGGRQGGGGPAPGSYAAMNFGDWQPAEPRASSPSDPAGLVRAWQQALRDLAELRGSLRDMPEQAQALEEILREYARYDPRRTPGNPALLERIHSQFLADLDRLELEWKRKLGEPVTQARNVADRRVPPKYAEAVAEYFRRLSARR